MHPNVADAPSSDIGSADKYRSGSICLGANRPSAPIHSQTHILVMLLDQVTFPRGLSLASKVMVHRLDNLHNVLLS